MISVIVCSVNRLQFDAVRENIARTIGCEFEIIGINNTIQSHSICRRYNEGAEKARFPVLCFVHEDVIFHSVNWGLELSKIFSDSAIGLVGVSGAIYKSKYPATWSACHSSLYRNNTIQHFRDKSEPQKIVINPGNKPLSEVVVLDGVFLATTRKVFNEFKFDETTFNGFHCYDLDYSLQVGNKYKLVVSNNILLEHLSEGNTNNAWYFDSRRLHKKWKLLLPRQISSAKISTDIIKLSDCMSCQSALKQAIRNDVGILAAFEHFLTLISRFFTCNRFTYGKMTITYLISKIPFAGVRGIGMARTIEK